MIIGIGTDLLDASRMRDGLARHGQAFADRLLAPDERAAYDASLDPARFLAKPSPRLPVPACARR